MIKKITLLLVVSLLLALAGCGGGGGGSTPSGPLPPTDLNVLDRALNSPLVVTLYWSAPEDSSVTQYRIYRKLLGEAIFTYLTTVPASQTSYTDLLSRNLDAQYEVTSVNASGRESIEAGPIYSEAPLPGPPD